FALSDDDPNWDRESPYKYMLAELVTDNGIRFVADIHGMSDRHKFGIAVGTMCGASCRRRHEAAIIETLQATRFSQATAAEVKEYPALRWDRFVVNHGRFTGGIINHTVTRFAVEELGIHAAQFELCASLRIAPGRAGASHKIDDRGDPAGIEQVVTA